MRDIIYIEPNTLVCMESIKNNTKLVLTTFDQTLKSTYSKKQLFVASSEIFRIYGKEVNPENWYQFLIAEFIYLWVNTDNKKYEKDFMSHKAPMKLSFEQAFKRGYMKP